MHTKEELEQMSDIELVTVASELGLQVKEDKLSTIYDIINREAENMASGESDAKPKRTRVARSTKSSKVFSAEQDGTVKSMETKRQRKTAIKKAAEAANPFSETTPTEETPKPAPKKRGRKSKAEKEAMLAAQKAAEEEAARKAMEAAQAEQAESTPAANETEAAAEGNEAGSTVMPAAMEQIPAVENNVEATEDVTPSQPAATKNENSTYDDEKVRELSLIHI